MSKKHFIALAAEIAKIENEGERIVAAIAVANARERLNPRFDRKVFLAACRAD